MEISRELGVSGINQNCNIEIFSNVLNKDRANDQDRFDYKFKSSNKTIPRLNYIS